MPQDKTRALFDRALDPGATEPEAQASIAQWLRRVREDGEPLVYFTKQEIEDRTGTAASDEDDKIDPVDALNKIGKACSAFADLLGVTGQPKKRATGGRR